MRSSSVKIVGIDPGSRITGYGIIEADHGNLNHIDCGGLHVPEKEPLEKKLLFIYEGLKKLLHRFRPDEASIEDVFFAKNAKSTLMLGYVRGVILLPLAEFSIPCHIYPAKEIKKAVTGYGNASKEQIQYMVKRLLNLPEETHEDASDALAIALCHARTIGFRNRLIK